MENPPLDPDLFYIVRGPYGRDDLCVGLQWFGPLYRRTDEDIFGYLKLLGLGRADEIPGPGRVLVVRDTALTGRNRPDVLGTVSPINMISLRLHEALTDLGVQNLKVFDVDFRDDRPRKDEPIPGYLGFLPDSTATEPVRAGGPDGTPGVMFFQGRIIQELLDRGIDGFYWVAPQFEDEALTGTLRQLPSGYNPEWEYLADE